jgi:hypothetical protein
MASSNYNCSIEQGFGFKKDVQVMIGHLTAMTIGTDVLEADMTMTLPTDLSNNTKVVGVMSNISWGGGYADPIYIDANVSTNNQVALLVMKHSTLKETSLTFQFNIYAYDPVAETYYLCCSSNGTSEVKMKGLIMKEGSDLVLDISEVNNVRPSSPLNYPFTIGIMPQESAQVLNFAMSVSKKLVKTWGVATADS